MVIINKPQRKNDIPPGWGEDQLSNFINNAIQNSYATFHNLKAEYDLLKNINNIFEVLSDNLSNTPALIPALFFNRAHAAFLHAVRLVISGAIYETFVLLRNCIEHSIYAFYVNKDKDRQEIWLRRHDNAECKSKMKKEFRNVKIFDYLKINDEMLYIIVLYLYETTIDFGAHPNPAALFSVISQTTEENIHTFHSSYLVDDVTSLKFGLRVTAQVGICSLKVFQKIYMERFNILGLSQQIDILSKGL
ncbi:MAG: hypothetical protein HZB23_11695 [Deltaproteobacteria bacterium]|nr:hypothetical protein [Deltaproteobacteria bacterium]